MDSTGGQKKWPKDWGEFIRGLFQDAEPYLSVRGDVLHAKISHGYALALMREEGGDPRIIEPAVILHDVGWSCLTPDAIKGAYGVKAGGHESHTLNRIHEAAGERIAREILKGYSYDSDLISIIASIIRTHDSGKQVRSMEEAIVKDADKLWRFSETGFSTEFKRQEITALDLYRHLESHVREWFFTNTALRIAEEELGKRREEFLRES